MSRSATLFLMAMTLISCTKSNPDPSTQNPITGNGNKAVPSVAIIPSNNAQVANTVILSTQLELFMKSAKDIALRKLPDIPAKDYSRGSISPFYSSRMNSIPSGVMVEFPIRGSHRVEKLGEIEDRVIIIYLDDNKSEPEVKRIRAWLNENSMPLKQH